MILLSTKNVQAMIGLNLDLNAGYLNRPFNNHLQNTEKILIHSLQKGKKCNSF